MKSKEELNALKEEELAQVAGGNGPIQPPPCHTTMVEKPPAGTCDVAIDTPECASCPSNPKNKPYNPLVGNPFNPYNVL